MIFTENKLKGSYIIELEKHIDDRGFFARSWCQKEFEEHGLNPRLVQCNISFNSKKGTLRGMHYQAAPYEEAKLIRCVRGSIYDVIVDIRADSATYCQWIGIELSSPRFHLPSSTSLLPADYRMLYVPEGFAHGFITLEDDTEVFYQMSEFYAAESARGVRWNDPVFNIQWPSEVKVISDRDMTYPNFSL